MAIISSRNAVAILAVLVATTWSSEAFAPRAARGVAPSSTASMQRAIGQSIASSSFVAKTHRRAPATTSRTITSLRMSADDFNESKYTEAAWSAIAALTNAADYYEASTVEAPILLDVLLNPNKHKAGEEAESARRVVEKVFERAGVNVKEMRSELEKYLAKQPKVSDNANKVIGRNLQKVLEYARDSKKVLGVSGSLCSV